MPATASNRRSIAIEDVLRSRTRLGDLARTLVGLVAVLPRRAVVIASLAALTLGEVALQVALAVSGKRLLDQQLQTNDAALDGAWVLVSLALLAGTLFMVRARHVYQETVALRWREAAVRRLSRHIAAGSLEDLSAVPMAALREIVMTDAPYLTRFAVETFAQLIVLALWGVAALGVLLAFGAPLLLVLAVVVIACALIFGIGARRHLALTGERFERTAGLSQAARDVVEVERVMLTRQFGLGARFVDAFHRAHDALHAVALRQARLSATIRSGLAVLNAVAFIGLVLVGARFIAAGTLDPGALLASLFVVGQLLGAVLQTGDLAGRMAEAATAGRRLSVYWDVPPVTAALAAVASRASGDGSAPVVSSLETDSLSFGFVPGRQVFRDVEICLRRGELAALTAETGAGKSTFARVLCGLLEPSAGRVSVRFASAAAPERTSVPASAPTSAPTSVRTPVPASAPIASLAAGQVLYLGAQPIALPGSLADNLFLDRDAALPVSSEFAVVREALARDGVPLDWSEPLIDAAGNGLSSGQSQLLQLARAVVRDPAIVVFDEATSSLDMATERHVQSALIDWCRQRVCLVVSHRDCPWLEGAGQRLTW